MTLPLQVVALSLNPFLVLDQAVFVGMIVVIVVKQIRHPVAKDVHGIINGLFIQGFLNNDGIKYLPPRGEMIFRRAVFIGRRKRDAGFEVVTPRREEVVRVESLLTLSATTFFCVVIDEIVTP